MMGEQMNRFLLPVMFIVTTYTGLAQECSNDDLASFCQTKTAVLRLLSYPAYTRSDEKVLNQAGDMAALAIVRTVSMEDFSSAEKARQILLILNMAFAAPQLIAASTDRRPTAAMLLLDHMEKEYCGEKTCNEVENIRNEIKHNTSTGRPYEVVTLKGEPLPDIEHMQWVGSVLRWTQDIKPGMTRQDLLRVYTTEGGLSTGTRRTYVLKGCPYIKVDVEFKAIGRQERDQDGRVTLMEDGRDIIDKISKPYLGYSILD
jgi:hypothetical protein